MIQRKYIELMKKGCWVLYRVDYFYDNKPCWYYELHHIRRFSGDDEVLHFGEKKLNALKEMMSTLEIA